MLRSQVLFHFFLSFQVGKKWEIFWSKYFYPIISTRIMVIIRVITIIWTIVTNENGYYTQVNVYICVQRASTHTQRETEKERSIALEKTEELSQL